MLVYIKPWLDLRKKKGREVGEEGRGGGVEGRERERGGANTGFEECYSVQTKTQISNLRIGFMDLIQG